MIKPVCLQQHKIPDKLVFASHLLPLKSLLFYPLHLPLLLQSELIPVRLRNQKK